MAPSDTFTSGYFLILIFRPSERIKRLVLLLNITLSAFYFLTHLLSQPLLVFSTKHHQLTVGIIVHNKCYLFIIKTMRLYSITKSLIVLFAGTFQRRRWSQVLTRAPFVIHRLVVHSHSVITIQFPVVHSTQRTLSTSPRISSP